MTPYDVDNFPRHLVKLGFNIAVNTDCDIWDSCDRRKGGCDTGCDAARRHPRIGLEKCTLRQLSASWPDVPLTSEGTNRWSRGPVTQEGIATLPGILGMHQVSFAPAVLP